MSTDLHSHHGTHIMLPGDLVSTPLKPEISTVLADGETPTSSGPVVVRIHWLVFGVGAPAQAHLSPPRPLDALHDPYPPSMLDPEDIDSHIGDDDDDSRACARLISGKYGVFPCEEHIPRIAQFFDTSRTPSLVTCSSAVF